MTKHIALLAAGTFLLSACQTQPDGTDVAAASAPATLSEITHLPLGNATLHEFGDLLFTTGMSTIEDGVRSLYQPSVRWEADILWATEATAVRMNSINSRLSGEATTSSLALDRIDEDHWRIDAKFVSPRYAVNVYSGERRVGTLRPDQGQIQAFLPCWPRPCRPIFRSRMYSPPSGAEAMLQQCSWEMASPEGIGATQGNKVLRGDRVEIIEDPHESYGGFDEIQVLSDGDVMYLAEEVALE